MHLVSSSLQQPLLPLNFRNVFCENIQQVWSYLTSFPLWLTIFEYFTHYFWLNYHLEILASTSRPQNWRWYQRHPRLYKCFIFSNNVFEKIDLCPANLNVLSYTNLWGISITLLQTLSQTILSFQRALFADVSRRLC